jgi:hypothetical protein
VEPIQIEDLQRVQLEKDDVLVVRINEKFLAQDKIEHARKELRAFFPNNQVLVVPAGTDIFVLAREQE